MDPSVVALLMSQRDRSMLKAVAPMNMYSKSVVSLLNMSRKKEGHKQFLRERTHKNEIQRGERQASSLSRPHLHVPPTDICCEFGQAIKKPPLISAIAGLVGLIESPRHLPRVKSPACESVSIEEHASHVCRANYPVAQVPIKGRSAMEHQVK